MLAATPIDVVADFFPDFDKHDRLAALAAMRDVETLVMVGRQDKVTPLAHSEAIADELPHAELVVLEDCGHMLLLEHHDVVTDELHAAGRAVRSQRPAKPRPRPPSTTPYGDDRAATIRLDGADRRGDERARRRLATVLRAGDLVLLSGPLGAGKTTLVRGLGAAMGVRGAVTSPTFVIARVHPSLTGGPALVHADAYRLRRPRRARRPRPRRRPRHVGHGGRVGHRRGRGAGRVAARGHDRPGGRPPTTGRSS